jgi:hypothetical protein
MYSINQSVSQILRNHTIFTALGTFGIAYFGYSLFANLNLEKIYQNKIYQNKIHKEIKQIISDYTEDVEKNNYKIDENTKKHRIAFTLNNFEPNKEWQVDLSNKEMLNAINDLQNTFSLSNISIEMSRYPYYNRIVLERDNFNNIKLSFDD